mgnify:CR=1 FL=1
MKTEGMIIGSFDNLSDFEQYGTLALESLRWAAAHWTDPFEVGKTMIADGKVAVNAQTPTLAPETKLEAHRKFIDIHVPISGPEILGRSETSTLTDVAVPYNEEKDVELFFGKPQQTAVVTPGQFVIFYPADAHAPNMGEAGKSHQKLCIKIPVD